MSYALLTLPPVSPTPSGLRHLYLSPGGIGSVAIYQYSILHGHKIIGTKFRRAEDGERWVPVSPTYEEATALLASVKGELWGRTAVEEELVRRGLVVPA